VPSPTTQKTSDVLLYRSVWSEMQVFPCRSVDLICWWVYIDPLIWSVGGFISICWSDLLVGSCRPVDLICWWFYFDPLVWSISGFMSIRWSDLLEVLFRSVDLICWFVRNCPLIWSVGGFCWFIRSWQSWRSSRSWCSPGCPRDLQEVALPPHPRASLRELSRDGAVQR